VQDSSAQLVSYLLDPQPGEVVMMLVLRRGKTTHITELMGIKAQCGLAIALPPGSKLKENTERLQLQSIQIFVGDSRDLYQFNNSADRVLLDAPCSVWELCTVMPMLVGGKRVCPGTFCSTEPAFITNITGSEPGGVLVYATARYIFRK